jgi:hypothetical protein
MTWLIGLIAASLIVSALFAAARRIRHRALWDALYDPHGAIAELRRRGLWHDGYAVEEWGANKPWPIFWPVSSRLTITRR